MNVTRDAKRLLVIVACVVLVCATAAGALAETAVVNNPDPTDRLNLRDSPGSKGNSLRKYYSGVEVEILSSPSSDWAKVRIGSAEGYMLKKFLATGSAAASVQHAIPTGVVNVSYPQTKLALRERDSDDSAAVGSYDNGTSVLVLGVADSWLHVRVIGDGRMGFMRSAWITQAENLEAAAVRADRATFRQSPKPDGKSLGVYGKNVPMVVLFSFEKLEGWSRVRIGDTVGFMRSSDLVYNPEPGVAPFTPETRVISNKGSHVNLREKASSSANVREKLKDGTAVVVIGTAGDWTHVQADGLYGYVQSQFLK